LFGASAEQVEANTNGGMQLFFYSSSGSEATGGEENDVFN
jgi:adenosylmethionine-8-amino-7-oxononanoate aminotransferase